MNPAPRKRSSVFRFKWQPPAHRRQTGVSRFCHFLTPALGASPCSMKITAPPGFSTRPISLTAPVVSAIQHSDHVITPVHARVRQPKLVGILVQQGRQETALWPSSSAHARSSSGHSFDAVELRAHGSCIEMGCSGGIDAHVQGPHRAPPPRLRHAGGQLVLLHGVVNQSLEDAPGWI